MKVRVRQIYYSNQQFGLIDPSFIGYKNQTSNQYLENRVIVELHQSDDFASCDYYGVLSWRFYDKIGLRGEQFLDKINGSHDVYSFFKNPALKFGDKNMKINTWVQADMWHKGFTNIGNFLFNEMGIDLDVRKIETEPIYYNYWICRSEIFEEYVSKWLIPAMVAMERCLPLQDLLFADADYKAAQKVDETTCMKIFGKPYYPYHPFILERLFGTFIKQKGYTINHLK